MKRCLYSRETINARLPGCIFVQFLFFKIVFTGLWKEVPYVSFDSNVCGQWHREWIQEWRWGYSRYRKALQTGYRCSSTAEKGNWKGHLKRQSPQNQNEFVLIASVGCSWVLFINPFFFLFWRLQELITFILSRKTHWTLGNALCTLRPIMKRFLIGSSSMNTAATAWVAAPGGGARCGVAFREPLGLAVGSACLCLRGQFSVTHSYWILMRGISRVAAGVSCRMDYIVAAVKVAKWCPGLFFNMNTPCRFWPTLTLLKCVSLWDWIWVHLSASRLPCSPPRARTSLTRVLE